jgi:hypothetical protein
MPLTLNSPAIGKIYYLIDFGILPTVAIHFRYTQYANFD